MADFCRGPPMERRLQGATLKFNGLKSMKGQELRGMPTDSAIKMNASAQKVNNSQCLRQA
jgi:hypothetical protein